MQWRLLLLPCNWGFHPNKSGRVWVLIGGLSVGLNIWMETEEKVLIDDYAHHPAEIRGIS